MSQVCSAPVCYRKRTKVRQDLVSSYNFGRYYGGLTDSDLPWRFNQFEPVKDTPLWKTKESNTKKFTVDTIKAGQELWKKFTNLVLLTAQMSQKNDTQYRHLLGRAKAGTITSEDLHLFNT
jgi:hypothetical protein